MFILIEDRYLKKYKVSLENTEVCIVGYYLILGIKISQNAKNTLMLKFYQFNKYSSSSQSNNLFLLFK